MILVLLLSAYLHFFANHTWNQVSCQLRKLSHNAKSSAIVHHFVFCTCTKTHLIPKRKLETTSKFRQMTISYCAIQWYNFFGEFQNFIFFGSHSRDLMPDKSWRAYGRAQSQLYAFPVHFSTAFEPFASCFICSRVQLRGIFFFWLCFETPLHSCKCVFLPESEKVSLWNSHKSERASGVHH